MDRTSIFMHEGRKHVLKINTPINKTVNKNVKLIVQS